MSTRRAPACGGPIQCSRNPVDDQLSLSIRWLGFVIGRHLTPIEMVEHILPVFGVGALEIALGVGEGSRLSMGQKPRPVKEGILARGHWLRIAAFGAVMATTVLAAMAASIYLLNFDQRQAVTVAFCTLAFAQMWHVFNMRDELGRFFDNEITRNRWIWAALVLCLILVLAAVYTPVLSTVLILSDPGARGWMLIVPASLVPLVAAPLVRLLSRLGSDDQSETSRT